MDKIKNECAKTRAWFNLSIGKWKIKYTPIPNGRTDYPYCNDKGEILVRVSGKMGEKGYFLNEKTGERQDKALRLVKGKAVAGFTGRIKEVDDSKIIYCEEKDIEDLSEEDEYLAESQELYEHLVSTGRAVKFGSFYGNGFNAKTTIIFPSKLYKGFLVMKAGHSGKGERVAEIIRNSEEIKQKAQMLKSIEMGIGNINQAKVEDLLI